MIVVDAGVASSWPNMATIEAGLWGGGHGYENWRGEIAYQSGSEPLAAFFGP